MISIIAILAALLLPALKRARDSARGISCINQLKQWSLADHGYSSDYSGYMARVKESNSSEKISCWAVDDSSNVRNTEQRSTDYPLGPYIPLKAAYRKLRVFPSIEKRAKLSYLRTYLFGTLEIESAKSYYVKDTVLCFPAAEVADVGHVQQIDPARQIRRDRE